MASNMSSGNLGSLRTSLQALESAVQEPRDEAHSTTLVLSAFPPVIDHFIDMLSMQLARIGSTTLATEAVFIQAHDRGWLRGEPGLWVRLVDHYEIIVSGKSLTREAESSICQDVRACSYMFWEAYDLLNSKFRWQTQIRAIPVFEKAQANMPVAG